MMIEELFSSLAANLPNLRNRFAFIGFIVAIGGYIVSRHLAPENIVAQVAAGSVGITLIIFGQIFYFLKDFPLEDRARLVVLMFFLFCIFMIFELSIAALYLYKSRQPVIPPDSCSISFPRPIAFKIAAREIARIKNMAVDSSSCQQKFLNMKVMPISLSANTCEQLIENLQFHMLDDGVIKVDVIFSKEKGVYHVSCQ